MATNVQGLPRAGAPAPVEGVLLCRVGGFRTAQKSFSGLTINTTLELPRGQIENCVEEILGDLY